MILYLKYLKNKKFHSLLGIKNKEKSAIYKEMKDAEFVLRYLSFKDTWQSFSGSIMRNMDHYMVDNQKMPLVEIKAANDDFLQAITLVEAAFGGHAFRRWVPEKSQWRQQIIAALFDAEMFACRGFSEDILRKNQPKIIENMKTLFLNSDFRKSIDSATNSPGSFRERIRIVREMITSTIAE
jgi:hypothetical protein